MILLMDWARARREAQRRLTDVNGRLAAAERKLADAQAVLQLAEHRFSDADGQVAMAEETLDAARAARDLARRGRYAARQDRDRATLAIERLQRRARDLSGRLDRMPPLEPASRGCLVPCRHAGPPHPCPPVPAWVT
jgi:chromosome segregation ATPase